MVSETRVSAERPHPHRVMCEKNLQLTVNGLLCAQNPSQISMNPVPSSPSILPTSPLQSVLSLLRPVTQLVCSALLCSPRRWSFIYSLLLVCITHTRTHAGRQAMLILKTIECSKQPAPPLPENTPLLAGKHTLTQIFLPIWSHADGALRQRRV